MLDYKMIVVVCLFLPCACAIGRKGKKNVEIVKHLKAEDDEAYEKALKAATRKTEVYDKFETKLHMSTTYLSPRFRAAFDARLKSLMRLAPFSLGDAGQNMGFFVSVFAPNEDSLDLNNQNHWTITLEHNKDVLNPRVVRFLSDKERWKPFFSYVNTWSKEFFVMFDLPASTPKSPDLLKESEIKVSFSNAEATVLMSW